MITISKTMSLLLINTAKSKVAMNIKFNKLTKFIIRRKNWYALALLKNSVRVFFSALIFLTLINQFTHPNGNRAIWLFVFDLVLSVLTLIMYSYYDWKAIKLRNRHKAIKIKHYKQLNKFN